MSKEDYYETLGVNNSASDGEINQAYRKKAMKHHPDRNKGDKKAEKEFKKINEAYYVLKDKEKKSQYDQFGHQAFENGGAGFKDFNFGGGFSDIFEEMFGDFDEDIGSIYPVFSIIEDYESLISIIKISINRDKTNIEHLEVLRNAYIKIKDYINAEKIYQLILELE